MPQSSMLAKISAIRNRTRAIKNRDLYAVDEDSCSAFMSPDTLDVTSNIDELRGYIEKDSNRVKAKGELPSILPRRHNQILSHEAFHVYQVLNSTLLANYSLAARRVGFRKFAALEDISRRDLPFKEELPIALESYSIPHKAYILDIVKEHEGLCETIYTKANNEQFSIIDIVEGAAVGYQYLADHDLTGEIISFTSPEYTVVWNYFYQQAKGSLADARTVFLFMCDLYLKFLGIYHHGTEDFDNHIKLSIPHVGRLSKYREEFKDSSKRDVLFLTSLEQTGTDADGIGHLSRFAASLPYENQERFYVLIRSYAELFKSLTIAGSTDRDRYNTNKNKSIKRILSKKNPYMHTDFVLPCILSSPPEVQKFAHMPFEVDDVHYVDDMQDRIMVKATESEILNFIKRIEPIACMKNEEVFCCPEHGFKRRPIVLGCMLPKSLNSECQKYFNRSLQELLNE